MAIPEVQLGDGAICFGARLRFPGSGAARKLALIALAPTRIAVFVMLFNTLWSDRLHAVLRVRLAI